MATAATIPSTQGNVIIQQLKQQQQHIDTGGESENFQNFGNNFTNCPGFNIFQTTKPFL